MRRAERSESTGQEGGVAPLDVREVDAGVGADEAVGRLADDEVAAAAQDAHRLLLDERLVGERVVGVDGHQAVLGLRHDLLGDDHDVAVGELGVVAEHGGLGDEPGQVGADGDLGDAVEAEDGESAHGVSSVVTPTAARVVRARAAAVSGVRMTVGVTTQRMPSASTSATRSASASSITRVPAKGA